MLAWGTGAATRAGLVLILAGGLLVASLALLWCDTQARAAEQGHYCLQSGPHTSQKAMWSDDYGESWHE
jgi:hypothetical protein